MYTRLQTRCVHFGVSSMDWIISVVLYLCFDKKPVLKMPLLLRYRIRARHPWQPHRADACLMWSNHIFFPSGPLPDRTWTTTTGVWKSDWVATSRSWLHALLSWRSGGTRGAGDCQQIVMVPTGAASRCSIVLRNFQLIDSVHYQEGSRRYRHTRH